MPPQPLSSYLKSAGDYRLQFGDNAIENEPELARLFARVIVSHSQIEAQMGTLLVKILHAHAKPGYAMLNALTSTAAQTAALNAAAQAMLTGADLSAFAAIRQIVKSMAGKRNKFAHDLWGICPQVPNALITQKPSQSNEQVLKFDEIQRKDRKELIEYIQSQGDKFPPMPDLRNIYVYKKEDFEQIIDEFESTQRILNIFMLIIAPIPWPDDTLLPRPASISRGTLLRKLCDQPLFREERNLRRARRRKNLQPPS